MGEVWQPNAGIQSICLEGVESMRLNRKFLAVCLVALLIAALATGCGSSKQDAAKQGAAKVYTLKAGHVLAADHPYQLGLVKMAELMAQKSNGRIKMDVFPSSQLGNERDMVEGLQMGTLDVTLVSTAPLANFSNDFLVLDLPYLFKDKEQAFRVLDGPIGTKMLSGLEKNGIVGLQFWDNGMFNIMNSKRPLAHPSDLQGLKMRTMENPIHLATFRAFGANAIPMAWGEAYTALQNKTIDGVTCAFAVVWTQKLHEVTPYISRAWEFYVSAPLLMSKKTYDSMPDDLKKIVRESAKEAGAYMRKKMADDEEMQIKKLKEAGAKIIDVDREEWAKAVVDKVYSQFSPGKIDPALIKQIKEAK